MYYFIVVMFSFISDVIVCNKFMLHEKSCIHLAFFISSTDIGKDDKSDVHRY